MTAFIENSSKPPVMSQDDGIDTSLYDKYRSGVELKSSKHYASVFMALWCGDSDREGDHAVAQRNISQSNSWDTLNSIVDRDSHDPVKWLFMSDTQKQNALATGDIDDGALRQGSTGIIGAASCNAFPNVLSDAPVASSSVTFAYDDDAEQIRDGVIKVSKPKSFEANRPYNDCLMRVGIAIGLANLPGASYDSESAPAELHVASSKGWTGNGCIACGGQG